MAREKYGQVSVWGAEDGSDVMVQWLCGSAALDLEDDNKLQTSGSSGMFRSCMAIGCVVWDK